MEEKQPSDLNVNLDSRHEESANSKDREDRKEKKNRIAAIVLSAAAAICAVIGIGLWFQMQAGGKAYDGIREVSAEAATTVTAAAAAEEAAPLAETAAVAKTAETAATAATAAVAEKKPAEEIPIDFATLWQTCPDAYAWIRIPGTQIDYPVCQLAEGDQSFYLNHRADRVAEFAGAIYSENYNRRDFTDPLTVLYGHDMSNGSMFQNLHFYEDRAFFDENREVLIYLPDRVLHYRVFAAYNYNDDHLLLNNDNFEDPNVFYSFLQEILAQRSMSGFVDQNAELTRDSHVLTLSTCNAYDDQRYLVQCLLMNPEALN